jgi:transcriptional regulator with XRE-family HTH domain
MTKNESIAFGQRLRELRTDLDLSLATIAYRAGINPTSVWSCERGESNPKLSTILSLARALDVTPGSLLDPLVADDD